MDERFAALRSWLAEDLGMASFDIEPASEDASFRRYFRVRRAGGTVIAMDAPPEREDCRRYAAVAGAFSGLGLNVPRVLEADFERGFLLITDLGSALYLAALQKGDADRLYGDALTALLKLQGGGVPAADFLPPYDRRLLMNEMALFRDWYLARHLGYRPEAVLEEVLEDSFRRLADSALEQPRVWVHRDYHSRNLMVVEGDNPGILDFQDAVHGPLTYDLVSLLRDCYIAWPVERVEAWARGYFERARERGVFRGFEAAQFLRWFDWMGVQRHLKAIGIFARLDIRDRKPGFLKDIPRTLAYVREVSGRYRELSGLHRLLAALPGTNLAV